jgi:hypothetical protein
MSARAHQNGYAEPGVILPAPPLHRLKAPRGSACARVFGKDLSSRRQTKPAILFHQPVSRRRDLKSGLDILFVEKALISPPTAPVLANGKIHKAKQFEPRQSRMREQFLAHHPCHALFAGKFCFGLVHFVEAQRRPNWGGCWLASDQFRASEDRS